MIHLFFLIPNKCPVRSDYFYIFDFSASQRVPGEPEISVVSRARDLRSRDFRSAESSEGNVRGEGDEEQDYQLRAGVSRDQGIPIFD